MITGGFYNYDYVHQEEKKTKINGFIIKCPSCGVNSFVNPPTDSFISAISCPACGSSTLGDEMRRYLERLK